MIYFVKTADGQALKIGYTHQPIRVRLRGLEQEYGPGLVLLGTMPGTLADEKALHHRFADHRRFERCRSSYRRELFNPVAEILELISAGVVPPERPTDVPVKMDSEVVRKAKIVAAFRGQSLAEFLSDTMGKIVDDLIDEAYAREKGGKPAAREGRKGAK